MSYLDRITACNNFNSTAYRSLIIEEQVYGQVQPRFAEQLMQWPEIFSLKNSHIILNPALVNSALRSEAVKPIFWQLYQQGVIDAWVNELYPVVLNFGEPPLLTVERAATSFLGVKTFGIHVNGLVQKADGIYVWVGTRSLDKPFWPGKLDQMVAGGQPLGLSLMDNLLKEAHEEANIPAALANQAQAVGAIAYQQQGWRGLDNSTIYIYDLWLPEDFLPENTDGEVMNFQLMTLEEIAYLTENTEEFKDNCNLINIDLLLRMGKINQQHSDYWQIKHNLYNAGK